MTTEQEIQFAQTQWEYLKDEELKALTRGDKADEAACSRLRDHLYKRIAFLQALQSQ